VKVAGYDDPSTIRILGNVIVKGISITQLKESDTLKMALTFSLGQVVHEALMPDPAVDLVKVVISAVTQVQTGRRRAAEGAVDVEFSVVKLFGTKAELVQIQAAIIDVNNIAYFFASARAVVNFGATVGSIQVVSSSIVPVFEASADDVGLGSGSGSDDLVVEKFGTSKAKKETSGGLTILACM
jgi:hypothetical protein